MHPKDTFFQKKLTLNCRGKLLNLSTPIVMGILNVTPDSFYDGGKHLNDDDIRNRIKQIISEGADIIDLGAVSTRPGSEVLTSEIEKERLEVSLRILKNEFPEAIVSLDTFRSDVAQWAVSNFSVSIINDISGGTLDDKMFEVIADLNVPYIMMHIKGTPKDMQVNPEYKDVVLDVKDFFAEQIEKLKLLGVNDIILDPGFGFAKNLDHNYKLLNQLDDFKVFDLPILVGVSRKSMVNKLLDIKAKDALNGTTVLNTVSLEKGANILRVHDVKEAVEAVKIFSKLKEV